MKKLFIHALLLIASVSTALASDCCNKAPKGAHAREGFINVCDATINDQFVPGGPIFYRLQGQGDERRPTLIFLHYLEGSHKAFLCQQAQFSKHYRTLSIDLRGRGDSVKTNPSVFNYTNQAMASDLKQVLKKLRIKGSLVIIGSVSGGYVALKFIDLYNNPSSPYFDNSVCVKKLVFINSGPGLTTVPDCAGVPGCTVTPGGCVVQPEPETCTNFCSGCGLCFDAGIVTTSAYCFFLKPLFANNYCGAAIGFGLSVFPENCVGLENAQQAFAEDFLKTTAEIQDNLYTNALAEDLRPVVQSLTIPTLVVFGDLSATGSGSSFYLFNNIPGSNLVLFANKGEQPQITDFRNFNTLLKNFLKGNLIPGTSTTINNPDCCICPCYKPTHPVVCPSAKVVDGKALKGQLKKKVSKKA